MTQLSPSYLRECFDYDPDSGVLTWKTRPRSHFETTTGMRIFNKRLSGKPAGTKTKKHLRVSVNGISIAIHRAAWAVHFGRLPYDQIDHINGDGFDNRLTNLREVDNEGNQKNATLRRSNKTGIPGVNFHKREKAYKVRANKDGKRVSIGTFQSLLDAAAARKSAENRFGYHENHGRPRAVGLEEGWSYGGGE